MFNPRHWERWERIRSRGRLRFVWMYGICGWGLSVGCLLAVFTAIDLISARHPFSPIAIVPVLLCPAGGFVFGSLMWRVIETKYLAAREADRKEQEQIAAIDALTAEVDELRLLLRMQHKSDAPAAETGISELAD